MRCPGCGKDNPQDSRFCNACGATLSAEAAPVREERKVVTVLFCDLVGFTSRTESMDPEDVRALLVGYHERVRDELERHGGTVEKFVGDAVMALFGAPVAHEDDPERAVRAALAIRDWADEQEDLRLRIGITTGEALVTLAARPEAGEAMASGDVVNTASRLQAAAAENGILVDKTTQRASSAAIDYREGGRRELKGKLGGVPVWEAHRARARVDVEAFETGAPLVGRQRELDVLLDAFARTRSERDPQLVTLLGVPGIGKSRLVYEFFRRGVERDPDLIYWRQGRCLPYGDGVTFWAVAEMVKAQAGVLETDGLEEAGAKLERAVEQVTGEDARWVAPHLRPLVGLGEEAEPGGERQAESFAAWSRFFEGLAEQRPLVLVFEDLQWADDGLLAFVDHLVEWATGVPLLVVCTARPELLDRSPGWGGGKLNATTLRVSPLSDEESSRLLATLLGRPVLPVEDQQALLTHAAGNPLYAEQYARVVTERGSAEGLPLPENVQGLIAARLDLLSPQEKGILQDAAVVGKTFWPGPLRAMGAEGPIGEVLHALERKEFVRRGPRSAVGGEPEYSFRHVLLRDVAYGQIPRGLRAEKHRQTAVWIDSLGRPDDHAEMLAYHYGSALDLARASRTEDAALVGAAERAFRQAGDRAESLKAFHQAARFYERALELSTLEADRTQLLFRLGRAQFHQTGEGGREPLEQALDALVTQGELEAAAEAQSMLALLDFLGGDHDGSLARHRRAKSLVEDLPASRSKCVVVADFARFLNTASDDEVIPVAREALELAEELNLPSMRAFALNISGAARCARGDTRGFDDLEQALRISLEVESPMEILRGYNNLAAMHCDSGDLRRRAKLLALGSEAAERFGHIFRRRWFRAERILEDYWSGRWDDALRGVEEFLATDAASLPYMEPVAREVRGVVRIARGDVEGLADTADALHAARTIKDPQVLFPALADHAAALVAAARTADAAAPTDELLDHWREVSRRLLPGQWMPGLAVAVSAVGREAAFVEVAGEVGGRTRWLDAGCALVAGDFEGAAALFEEIGSRPDEAYARLRSGSEREIGRALDFYRSVGATRYEQECEALLAASA